MDKGILYGVGVGPGDPELMTIKALNIIKNNDIIFVPGSSKEQSVAYGIVKKILPELENKAVSAVSMPMTKDKESLKKSHFEISQSIRTHLDEGENVVFLTLGDPGIYSTFSYIKNILAQDGYEIITVPGVMSITAVAARLNVSLAEWDEKVHIIPASYGGEYDTDLDGTTVFMKPRGDMRAFKSAMERAKKSVVGVSNCGKENEVIYDSLETIPDEVGYMTVFIAK